MTKTIHRPAEILRSLIRCPSVTPHEAGALTYLESQLQRLGFQVERIVFSDEQSPDVENLYARYGKFAPHVMFAGHTDVVPPGDADDWLAAPFSGDIRDGKLYGRGAVDMKGGIACFLAAVETFLGKNSAPVGSISFLITGDEEGPSINGTDKLLQWAAKNGEQWDACIVGEPSNPNAIGDAIKNGRRGSLSGKVTVMGIQGHAAYPHLADNPIRGLMDLLAALLETPFDKGTQSFQSSNLEVTSVDVGNPATNVIPAKASASFNIRFNDTWTDETVRNEIVSRFSKGAKSNRLRSGKKDEVRFDVEWVGRPSPVFLTEDPKLVGSLRDSVRAVTGKVPELSTGGGTSDARFIKDYCPVVEFGLVGKTMHQINECTSLDDLDTLTRIYAHFLETYFAASIT